MSLENITVGIPAYHAEKTIVDCLSSIQIQTIQKNVSIIIAKDDPKDNYDFLFDLFPNLNIKILDTEKNTGPGLARQRCLDACKTDWITFIDADDVFFTPFSLEQLRNNITSNCIAVQGVFLQEITEKNPENIRYFPQENPNHPWVFGRLYNVKFLKETGIKFSSLRAMEDGELNWKIRMTIEGTPFMINCIGDPVYLWRTGSDHSITRIGIEENDGEPLYNWDLCQVGATAAAINAVNFCKKKNPFNGNITRFTVEQMIEQYFTYVKCLKRKPLFAKQNFFNAKRFYNECYKNIANQIEPEVLEEMYTFINAKNASDLIGIIPEITFFEFMEQIASSTFGGREEFNLIRKELPNWVQELDLKSGVLGKEGYI